MEFKCDQCDLKYKSKNKLNQHHAAKHQMICYKCEQCDLKYTQTQGLHMHVRDKHNGEKLSCDSCDFQTGVASGKQQMAAHRRLKHGEQKLKCGMCDFETYHASMLCDHKKRIHELNKLAKARKTRKSPGTLGLKKFELGKLRVKKVFRKYTFQKYTFIRVIMLLRVIRIRSSLGILTHQGHICKVNANA